MTPIERAARAMYAEISPEWDWNDPEAELLRRMYRENAQAALASLRDPTPAMLAAAEGLNDPAALWTAMMDVALSEEG